MRLTELFCDVDDFCQVFLPIWEQKQIRDGSRKRLRKAHLSISEIMTMEIVGEYLGIDAEFGMYRFFRRHQHVVVTNGTLLCRFT